ncbi:MAG TPA: TonB family protein [Accumulibacter sp.]|uniref:energy transducer TonB n=1 Tax=Accumulibacter sp. TaxID=2053492 RepID=UPI00287B1969|nr:TonB family protein [Accumulibacter sp.]MDS4053859.1 TonB family protein [Accumulibacter sp.]HMV06153.1 TonB family protein [Accumulibacter sp.]HMW63762.1 TonB family protein [Accumulibacter sp.]HMW81522.1 TonB family protein [Accumulibacter sp.]HMX70013.1 TonB family protein [Accumulibacter sp.]
MSSRLLSCCAASLALHLSLLLPDIVQPNTAAPRTWLHASLRLPQPPPASLDPAVPDERLLKNTLNSEQRRTRAAPDRTSRAVDPRASRRAVESAQRKLAQHLFYPPEAIARGLEGETRLLLTLDESGRITEVGIAASSGHAILDQAAIRAARTLGRLTWSETRELLLPVVFRLE